jgi:hypothetical protein
MSSVTDSEEVSQITLVLIEFLHHRKHCECLCSRGGDVVFIQHGPVRC